MSEIYNDNNMFNIITSLALNAYLPSLNRRSRDVGKRFRSRIYARLGINELILS